MQFLEDGVQTVALFPMNLKLKHVHKLNIIFYLIKASIIPCFYFYFKI